jgi:hypothetical protein
MTPRYVVTVGFLAIERASMPMQAGQILKALSAKRRRTAGGKRSKDKYEFV